MQPLEYRQSDYWLVLNFSTALFSVFVALVLIAACACDVLVNVIEDSSTDFLSGLKQRRAFDMTAREKMLEAAKTRVSVSMVLLDIDDFKKINDEFGHPCASGDGP